MESRLVNVRLDADRLRKARALRQRGITLSDLVRQSIDARFDEVARAHSRPRAAALVAELFAEHPDPPGIPARRDDVHDRRAARAAIVRRLRRRGQ